MSNDSPTIITIFGITGDLAMRKLIPALLDLENADILNKELKIIGFSRRSFSHDDFRVFVRSAIDNHNDQHSSEIVERFLNRFSYIQGLFDQSGDYAKLGEMMLEMERTDFGRCANKLYYLATSPDYYEIIFKELANSGLTIPCSGVAGHLTFPASNGKNGWARICVEKPFGRDINTAESLDKLLGKLFREEQIFRIDHYLAKEAVQNLIMFRFSNSLFEPLWNNKHISRVEILLHEKKNVGGRGAFFESVGALRDVGQNHLLQMLGLVAMEHPEALDAKHIREARSDILKHLELAEPFDRAVVRGQYKEYRTHSGIADDSETETYFRLEALLNTVRWKGVPFILEAGKSLGEDLSQVSIYFKSPKNCLACGLESCEHNNVLTFRIQPDEGIKLKFWIKRPGLHVALEAKELSFAYQGDSGSSRLPDAYERLLHDALLGDQTLFTSTDEVMASWKFITPIMKKWKDLPLLEYDAGNKPDLNFL